MIPSTPSALALALALCVPAPEVPADAGAAPAVAPDTFEVRFRITGQYPGREAKAVLEADHLTVEERRLVSLSRQGRIVGLFQVHQILYVANRSRTGPREFRIMTNTGESYTISGDRLIPEQDGTIRVTSGGVLVGLISTTSSMVQSVIDTGAGEVIYEESGSAAPRDSVRMGR